MKIIKIGAEWCAGCIIMKPRWQEIEQEYAAQGRALNTEYLDFDNDNDKVKALDPNIETIPVFFFLDDQGQELKRLTGEVSKAELIRIIDKLLAGEHTTPVGIIDTTQTPEEEETPDYFQV